MARCVFTLVLIVGALALVAVPTHESERFVAQYTAAYTALFGFAILAFRASFADLSPLCGGGAGGGASTDVDASLSFSCTGALRNHPVSGLLALLALGSGLGLVVVVIQGEVGYAQDKACAAAVAGLTAWLFLDVLRAKLHRAGADPDPAPGSGCGCCCSSFCSLVLVLLSLLVLWESASAAQVGGPENDANGQGRGLTRFYCPPCFDSWVAWRGSARGQVLTSPAYGPVGSFLELPSSWEARGGGLVHAYCTGAEEGSQAATVVFLHGYGGSALDAVWAERRMTALHPDLRFCSFDRPGYGWSDSGPVPRSAGTAGAELVTFLEARGVTGKVILMAHSLGNYNMMAFVRALGAQSVAEAAARPYRLEGAVIVDGLDPDWESGGAQDRPRAFCSADAAAHCDAWCYFWRGCAAVTPVGAARLVFFLDIMGFRSAVESFPADVFDRCVR